jgi:HEAT repeats
MSHNSEIDEICEIIASLGVFEVCRPTEIGWSSLHGSEVPRCISRLRALCAAGDPNVRIAAGLALSRVTGDRSMLLGTLISSLQGSDEMVRGTAMLAIAQLGGAGIEAAPHLIESLRCEGTRVDASSSLCAIGQSAIPLLIAALNTASGQVGEAIIRILCQISPTEQACVEALTACMTHQEENMRTVCLGMINAHNLCEYFDVQSVARLLDDGNFRTRNEVATFLRKSSSPFDEKLPYLLQCLKDVDPTIRLNALGSIGEHGSKARIALAGVVELLDDSDPTVRGAANAALDNILAGILRGREKGTLLM